MPREPLTLVGTSRTIRSVQSGIWAMEMRKNPAEFCGGLARQQARLLASFPIASLLLSPRAKTTRAFCGVFAFGRRTGEGKHDASHRAMMLSFFFLPFGLSGIDRVPSQNSWGGRGGLWVSVLSSFLSEGR